MSAPDGIRRQRAEVAILGGGPAGASTALALHAQGVRDIVLVEAGRYEDVRIGESVPPDTRRLLKQLGIWKEFERQGHEPCLGSCSSWGSQDLGYNDFLFNPYGSGWHLDRTAFDAFLVDQVRARGVDVRTHTRFEGASSAHGDTTLQLTGPDTSYRMAAGYVVDATGMKAAFARRAGARAQVVDRLVCVCGFFALPDGGTFSKLTMLEAVEQGWWYAARLPGGRLAVALATDPEVVRENRLTEKDRWSAWLERTRHLGPALEGCPPTGEDLIVRPAVSSRLERPFGKEWVAVGDAASSYDPISSQGIHKALTDGLLAAGAIAALRAGDDGPMTAYGRSVGERFEQYLVERAHFYDQEQRWPSSRFWRRRQAASVHSGPSGSNERPPPPLP